MTKFAIGFPFLVLIISSNVGVCAMSVSGPITASTVTVTGSVTLSSMTASSITVSNKLQLGAAVPGTIVQMHFSSSTLSVTTSTTYYYAVNGASVTVALTKPTNYFRISLTGVFENSDAAQHAYLTIKRDAIDLGETTNSSGLADAYHGAAELIMPVGIVITDSPGNTTNHTYQVFIRSGTGGLQSVSFPADAVAYLFIEEISPG